MGKHEVPYERGWLPNVFFAFEFFLLLICHIYLLIYTYLGWRQVIIGTPLLDFKTSFSHAFLVHIKLTLVATYVERPTPAVFPAFDVTSRMKIYGCCFENSVVQRSVFKTFFHMEVATIILWQWTTHIFLQSTQHCCENQNIFERHHYLQNNSFVDVVKKMINCDKNLGQI